jgi:hypothetical protein
MSRTKYLPAAGALLLIYGLAKLTDLDLGGFGVGILLGAAVFAIMALATPSSKGPTDGR